MFVAQGVSTDLSTKVDSRGEAGARGSKVPSSISAIVPSLKQFLVRRSILGAEVETW